MRIIVLVLIGMLSFTLTCSALSEEQLTQAEETLQQMGYIVYELHDLVQTARVGVEGRITLTPEQKQQLIDEYLGLKGDLPGLYQQLP